MRAARIHTCGEPPDVAELPDPQPGPGEALVAVTAAPITPLDLLCASGTSYFGAPATPYVPGVQGVGVVRSSATVAAGTTVWFPTSAGMAPGDGALAGLAVVDDAALVPVAGTLDDADLAALGLSAIAAWTALSLRAGLRPGERVLVLGSSGVVGTVGLQAARLLGASSVHGAAVEPDAVGAGLALGADGVVTLRRDEDVATLAARLRDAVGEVDVVLDPLCGVPSSAAALCLAPGGRLVNLGSSAGPTASYDSAHLRSGSREVRGYTNNDLTPVERASALTAVEAHATAGRLRVEHETFALADVTEAWTRQASGGLRGRAVVLPG